MGFGRKKQLPDFETVYDMGQEHLKFSEAVLDSCESDLDFPQLRCDSKDS